MATIVQLGASLAGLGLWGLLVVRHASLYRGSQAFYRLAQRDSGLGRRLAVAVLGGPLGAMARDYGTYRESVGRERISAAAIAQYSDESLSGYADETLDKGGEGVEQQQRGLILPLLGRALEGLEPGASVIEIGTGNGDVVAHLAAEHPELKFTGVDLSVATAVRKHAGVANADFVEGYALDLLEDGRLSGDLVFSSSTWIVFTPPELRAYVRALTAAGVSEIVLNEPTWAGHTQTNDASVASWHLEGATWHHNYAGYLAEAGYEIGDFEFFHYEHPVSPRPDIHVVLLRARRTGRAPAAQTAGTRKSRATDPS